MDNWSLGIQTSLVSDVIPHRLGDNEYPAVTLGSIRSTRAAFMDHVPVVDRDYALAMGRGVMYFCKDHYEVRPVHRLYASDIPAHIPVVYAEPHPTRIDANGFQNRALVAFKPVAYGRVSAHLTGDVGMKACSNVGRLIPEWACPKCGLNYTPGFLSNMGSSPLKNRIGWVHPPGYAERRKVKTVYYMAKGVFDSIRRVRGKGQALDRATRSALSDVTHSLVMVRKGVFFRTRVWVGDSSSFLNTCGPPGERERFWVWSGGDKLECLTKEERAYWEIGVVCAKDTDPSEEWGGAKWAKNNSPKIKRRPAVYE